MQVETPACVVDLDAVKHNIRVAVQMVTDAAPGRRVKIRPHAKSHKCTQLAQLQIVRVGVWGGVCCQTTPSRTNYGPLTRTAGPVGRHDDGRVLPEGGGG